MIPVVPTQAIMITSGALTVYGNLSLPLVIAIGAAGMFAGDSIAFLLGRSTGQVGRGRLSALREDRRGSEGDQSKHRHHHDLTKTRAIHSLSFR